jgi:hypothetical protein
MTVAEIYTRLTALGLTMRQFTELTGTEDAMLERRDTEVFG